MSLLSPKFRDGMIFIRRLQDSLCKGLNLLLRSFYGTVCTAVASRERRILRESPSMGPVALEFPRPQLAGDPTNDLGGGPYLAIGHARVLLVAKPYIHE